MLCFDWTPAGSVIRGQRLVWHSVWWYLQPVSSHGSEAEHLTHNYKKTQILRFILTNCKMLDVSLCASQSINNCYSIWNRILWWCDELYPLWWREQHHLIGPFDLQVLLQQIKELRWCNVWVFLTDCSELLILTPIYTNLNISNQTQLASTWSFSLIALFLIYYHSVLKSLL